MKEQFVPYELAVKLKELGFNEPCLAHYIKDNQYRIDKDKILLHVGRLDYDDIYKEYVLENVPLWQQAFDWFRRTQNLESSVYWSNNYKDYRFSVDNLTKIPNEGDLISMESKTFNTYEEARQACLEKLIELCKKK